MKLALCFMFAHGELPYLKLHLPACADSFDGVVAITDPTNTDGSIEHLQSLGAAVLVRPWVHDWGLFSTMLFASAEELGYDAAMRLDPDECLMADAGHIIRETLEHDAALLVFPRYEFFGDRLHYRADLYPDYQARAWRLRRGIIVQGHRHEGIHFDAHGLREGVGVPPEERVLRVSAPQIFHYGYASETGIRRAMRRYENHARIDHALPPVEGLLSTEPVMTCPTVSFPWGQPLDPHEVGATAPWSE